MVSEVQSCKTVQETGYESPQDTTEKVCDM